jgi:hypothetical protein
MVGGAPRPDDPGTTTDRFAGVDRMNTTPALTLLGILLVLLAIPLAFSFAPLVIGVIVLVVAVRRGHRELAEGPATSVAI